MNDWSFTNRFGDIRWKQYNSILQESMPAFLHHWPYSGSIHKKPFCSWTNPVLSASYNNEENGRACFVYSRTPVVSWPVLLLPYRKKKELPVYGFQESLWNNCLQGSWSLKCLSTKPRSFPAYEYREVSLLLTDPMKRNWPTSNCQQWRRVTSHAASKTGMHFW